MFFFFTHDHLSVPHSLATESTLNRYSAERVLVVKFSKQSYMDLNKTWMDEFMKIDKDMYFIQICTVFQFIELHPLRKCFVVRL